MAEDEAPLPVGRIPVYHPYAGLPATLANQPLGDVDPVVKYRHRVLHLTEEGTGGQSGEQRRVEVTAEHRLRFGLGFERGAGVEPERAGHGVLSHRETAHGVLGDLRGRHLGSKPCGEVAILGGAILAVPACTVSPRSSGRPWRPGSKQRMTKIPRRSVTDELPPIGIPGDISRPDRRAVHMSQRRRRHATAKRERRSQCTFQGGARRYDCRHWWRPAPWGPPWRGQRKRLLPCLSVLLQDRRPNRAVQWQAGGREPYSRARRSSAGVRRQLLAEAGWRMLLTSDSSDRRKPKPAQERVRLGELSAAAHHGSVQRSWSRRIRRPSRPGDHPRSDRLTGRRHRGECRR